MAKINKHSLNTITLAQIAKGIYITTNSQKMTLKGHYVRIQRAFSLF